MDPPSPELTSSPWIGPTSLTMTAAVTPYINWLSTTAAQAEETASQARAAVSAYEAAFAMTVPPPAIEANRALLMTLIATNFFGQNTPAIMATEALYMEMWAQDAAAMYGYAGASAAASQVTPFATPPQTTSQAGTNGQDAAVAQAAATPAGQAATVAQNAVATAPSTAAQTTASTTTATTASTTTRDDHHRRDDHNHVVPRNLASGVHPKHPGQQPPGRVRSRPHERKSEHFATSVPGLFWGWYWKLRLEHATADDVRSRRCDGRCRWCVVSDAAVRRPGRGLRWHTGVGGHRPGQHPGQAVGAPRFPRGHTVGNGGRPDAGQLRPTHRTDVECFAQRHADGQCR